MAQQVEALGQSLAAAFTAKEDRVRFLSSLTPDDYTRLAAVLPGLIDALQVVARAAATNAPKPERRRRHVKDSMAAPGAAEPDPDPRQPWVRDDAPPPEDAPARKEARAEAEAAAPKPKPKPKAARPAKRSPRRPKADVADRAVR